VDERQIDKLLIKISQGDNEAFERLYEGTKKGVFSFVYSYAENYACAEDVMQTVYLKVKIHISSYKKGTNGRAWLLQIAKNEALNELKKRKKTQSCENPTEKFEQLGYLTDIMRRVLTNEELQIVILHVLWGYKHREIAEELKCPTGTVTSKYKRSIQKLQNALKEDKA